MARSLRFLTLGFALALCACGKDDSTSKPSADADTAAAPSPPTSGIFAPVDEVAKTWGAFDFYGPHATMAGFQGHLALEPVGTLPATAGEPLAGAQVYRIVNAKELHDQSAHRDYRCLSPALWLAIKTGTPQIHVALFMMEDWKTFAPGKPGLCGSGIYEPG
ncbi:MAG TPA: hypothetical protein VK629_20415 [Steroidobacteraceae bacterium]|nr:hypothetical protein [Steroidobacteraceae bacterium]